MTNPVRHPSLKIGHGNGHNEMSLVELIKSSKCASFGCAEADRLLPHLKALDGFKTFAGGVTRAPGEVPIVVKANHRIIGHSAHKISDAIPGLTRVAPDRWVTEVRYHHPLAKQLDFKGVAHIAWHPDAGPKQLNGHDPKAPIVREYIQASQAIKQDAKHAREQGFLVIITGDLQMTEHADQPWAPRRLYASLGLNYAADRIDWIAYDPALRIKRMTTPELYDHPALITTFIAA